MNEKDAVSEMSAKGYRTSFKTLYRASVLLDSVKEKKKISQNCSLPCLHHPASFSGTHPGFPHQNMSSGNNRINYLLISTDYNIREIHKSEERLGIKISSVKFSVFCFVLL